MTDTRNFVTRMTTDTTGFKKGTEEVIAQLNKLNKSLVDNQYKQKECNKVIATSQKEIKELHKVQKEKGELDENQKKRLQELTDTIEQEKVKLSQLRTEQVGIRQAITETSRAVTENNSQWTVLKATLANLSSDVLQKLAAQIVNIGKDVIQTGEQFSASMSEVGAISGATAEQLQELESAARLYGATTKFSATESADALKYMALAGWDSQQAIAGLPAVLDLAAASGMDLGRASDIVTDYITAFGLEVEDASRFVDIMSYAMSNSNTTAEMLGEAYKNCAATAASMGFEVEEVTAALMTMANAGVKGGEAGTTLNTLMTRLATNTKGCADELSKYGVEIYDAEGNMNSLSSILEGMISAWDTLTQQQQANLSKIIAGTNQYAGFQTLMQGMSDKAKAAGMAFDDYTAALEQCDGTASDMAKTMSDNLTGDLKTLESALDELKLKLFDDAETPLRNLVKLATNGLVPALEGIIKNLKGIIPAIVGATTAMVSLKASMAISKVITDLKKAFDAATLSELAATVAAKGFKRTLDVLKADPIMLIISAFSTLVSVLGTVAIMNQNTADSFNNANESAKNYLETLQNVQTQADENNTQTQVECGKLKDLQGEYDRLRQIINPTIDDQSRLKTAAEQLAEKLGISTQALKDKNGAYKDITGSVEEYIKKLEEQTKLENAENGLTAAYTAYENAKKACEEYSEKIQEQQEIVDDAQRTFADAKKAADDYLKENHANPYKYDTSEYKKLAAVSREAKEDFEDQRNILDNLNDTWEQYYSQAVTATGGIIQYRQEMGYAVDADKEFEERCDSINILLDKFADTTEIVGKKTTSTSTAVSDYAKETKKLSAELTSITKSSDSAADKLTFLNRKLNDNGEEVTQTRDGIKELQKEIANAEKLRDENTSKGSSGYQLYSESIAKLNTQLENSKDKLANLLTQQTLIRSSVRQTKEEIQKSAKGAVTDLEGVEKAVEKIISAIDSTQKNAKLLASAEKEVAENGKLTLNTLNSIQKTYPALIDLTNDYINGIATEKQVIEGLKNAYENNKSSFTAAVAAKQLILQNYSEDFINNTINLFNEIRDKYDIDVENFKNAADAKQAINAELYGEMVRKQQEYDDFINDPNHAFGYSYGQPYLSVKQDDGEWRDATSQELQDYIDEMNQKSEDAYQAWKYYTDLQNISAFDDVYNAYLQGRKSADNLYNFVSAEIQADSAKSTSKSTSGNSSSNDKSTKNKVTITGAGVSASGDTNTSASMTWIERMKSLGRMSTEQEIIQLESLKKRTDNTADEIYQIELKLYQARTKLSEDSAKKRADIEKKSQDKYQAQLDLARAAYEAYVNGKIDAQRKIADEAKKSADIEIAALDAVMKKRNQEREDQKRKAEIDNINAQLRYNKNQLTDMEKTDLYRRKQNLINEQYEADYQRSMEQQKVDIQAKADRISLNAQNAIANMQSNISSFVNHLAMLTGTQTAAQKVVNNNQQQNIQIVQNALSDDQLVQRLVREIQKSLYTG